MTVRIGNEVLTGGQVRESVKVFNEEDRMWTQQIVTSFVERFDDIGVSGMIETIRFIRLGPKWGSVFIPVERSNQRVAPGRTIRDTLLGDIQGLRRPYYPKK